MTNAALFQGMFYLKKHGEAVIVAWLLYLGIIQLLWALTWPITLVLARTVNVVLEFFPESHAVAEPAAIWLSIVSSAAWGTIALSTGIALGLWRIHREHRWQCL